MTSTREPSDRRTSVSIGACFIGAAASAVGITIVYWWNDSIQLEGLFVGITFLLLAVGLIRWAHRFLPQGPYEEEYPELQSPAKEEAEVLATLDRGGIGRRRILIGSLGLVGASLAAAVGSSLRSLGPKPASLRHTAWRGGKLLVTKEGEPIHTADMPVNSVVTVFPKGFTNSPEVPALLIRLPPGLNRPLPGRASWAPQGFVCYSKVCAHAGCPVNLYDAQAHELTCPCHQSTFDVLRGAAPVFGPAGGPLVQLPLAIDPDGTLHSTGDFSGPPGPVYWHHT
jgi:ubiquinol-cytochrome c reductase iron-sulfur subunit